MISRDEAALALLQGLISNPALLAEMPRDGLQEADACLLIGEAVRLADAFLAAVTPPQRQDTSQWLKPEREETPPPTPLSRDTGHGASGTAYTNDT